MDNKSFVWRIWLAVVLTSLGVFYYLVFLFFLSGGVPIERIHYIMTDGWPNFAADNVPLIAPVFLAVGLYFWYSYTKKNKPKPVAEPEYVFQFTKVENHHEATPLTEDDFVFEAKAAKRAAQKRVTELPLEEAD